MYRHVFRHGVGRCNDDKQRFEQYTKARMAQKFLASIDNVKKRESVIESAAAQLHDEVHQSSMSKRTSKRSYLYTGAPVRV